MIDVGFIGLGIMGRPMASHLQAAGHRLFLHDVGPVARELVAAGGVVCKSGKEVAEEADVVSRIGRRKPISAKVKRAHLALAA